MKYRLHRLKNKITQVILVTGFWLLVTSSFAQPPDYIRVAIAQDAASLSIKIKGFFQITEAGTKKVLYREKDLKTTVTAYREGILLGGRNFKTNKVFISTNGSDVIIIDGRIFSGSVQFIKNNNGRLLVVNYIGLEDYIKGVMYHEASHYWPGEALKAQAIACRSYAIYSRQQNKLKSYDVTNDSYSQVYGGKVSERYRTNEVVDATKGQILTYQNKVFPAYFHATCAGHTEDAAMLWNIDIAPLKGVVCDYCKDSPHFGWHLVLDRGELRQRFINAGYKIGLIKTIEILGKNKSGRITDLKIVTTTKDISVSAKDFRNIVGHNEIRSTNFTVGLAGDDAVFEGFGWGHGVGLCQWGAYLMAKQGYTAEGILKYYYPGCEITSDATGRF